MAWVEALGNGRVWNQHRDAPRFRQGFINLAATCDRWPQPKHLLEAMPKIEQHALTHEATPATPEQAAAALEKIAAMLSQPMPVHRPPPVKRRQGPSLAEIEEELKRHFGAKP